MEQYIADKKVLGVTVLEDVKTPGGMEMVEVIFEDNSKETMPKSRFELTKTDSISDASGVQKVINEKIGATVYGFLVEYGISGSEVDGILDQAVMHVNEATRKATEVLFGGNPSRVSLIEINKILIKQHATTNTDGASSTGSTTDTSDTQ